MECPFYASVRAAHPEAWRLWPRTTVALRERLLLGRLRTAAQLKHALLQLPDLSWNFAFLADSTCRVNIFTDGSAWPKGAGGYTLASWAVISASHAQIIASGPMVGLLQSNNRAELFALIVALRWCLRCEVACAIWTDSSYASAGLLALLQGTVLEPDTHLDLWKELAELVAQLYPQQVFVQHVPGHAAVGPLQDVEAWAAHWNDIADTAAKDAHQLRPASFQELWQVFSCEWADGARCLRIFQAFHLALAAHGAMLPEVADQDEDLPSDEINFSIERTPAHAAALGDVLPIDWYPRWLASPLCKIFGAEFVFEFVSFLATESDTCISVFAVSWIELAALAFALRLPHPVPGVAAQGQIWG